MELDLRKQKLYRESKVNLDGGEMNLDIFGTWTLILLKQKLDKESELNLDGGENEPRYFQNLGLAASRKGKPNLTLRKQIL